MGNLTYCSYVKDKINPETAAMEIMFPGTIKEIQLSRELMTALDSIPSHSSLPDSVRQAFCDLYDHYQYQIDNQMP
mgnify:CR=1 FL=1|jgi:hypothetical protein